MHVGGIGGVVAKEKIEGVPFFLAFVWLIFGEKKNVCRQTGLLEEPRPVLEERFEKIL